MVPFCSVFGQGEVCDVASFAFTCNPMPQLPQAILG